METQTKNPPKEGKLNNFMKSVIGILNKVKDFYIRSLTECSTQLDYGMALSCPTGGQVPTVLPKSFSVSSTSSTRKSQDYNDLLRDASSKKYGNRIEIDRFGRQRDRKSPVDPTIVPRSHSVGIGKIEEDKEYDFDEEDKVVKTDLYPRSRSYSVSRRKAF